MPRFKVEIPHTLSASDAKSRLERFVDMLQSEHGARATDVEHSWSGNTLNFSFKTFGIKIVGAMLSEDQRLVVEGDLPFAAMMFKGKIESDMREQLGRLLR